MIDEITMFGLFKPPKENIRSKLPQHALTECDAVECYAAIKLDNLDEVRKNHILAFVLSVWACNSSHAGKFQLSQLQFRYVQNAGMNSIRMLGPDEKSQAESILLELAEKGLIPGILENKDP